PEEAEHLQRRPADPHRGQERRPDQGGPRVKRTLALAALLLGAATSSAAPPPPDAQDVVVLSEVRPYRVRLHLTVDGKPVNERWNAYLKRWFDYTDLNGDGVLDLAEAARAPSLALFQAMRQGNPINGVPFTPAPFNELDRNGDGKVTFAEFSAYYVA